MVRHADAARIAKNTRAQAQRLLTRWALTDPVDPCLTPGCTHPALHPLPHTPTPTRSPLA